MMQVVKEPIDVRHRRAPIIDHHAGDAAHSVEPSLDPPIDRGQDGSRIRVKVPLSWDDDDV